MKKYSHETVVGVFVVVGLLCVAYLTVKLGDATLFSRNSYPLYARFTTIAGLRVGNSIEMLGMRIGRVSDFTMDQDEQMVTVELQVNDDIRVYEDAIASIKTKGLIGDKYISIDAGGSGELLRPGDDIIETEAPLDLGDLIGKYAFGDVSK